MLTRETVEKVSRLARLQLTEKELEAFSAQLSAVLENFEQISKVDTQGAIPLVTPTEVSVHLRPDIAEAGGGEAMLANAPDKTGRLFKVPPVV